MQSSSITWMPSKDVAVKLDVHVRTLRNWIEAFSPYMVLQKNSQGHLLLSEQAYNLLVEIKKRKDTGLQTLKEVEDSLRADGLLPERIESDIIAPTPAALCNEVPVQAAAAIMEKLSELESSISQNFYESLNEFTQSYRQTASSMELVVLEAARSERKSQGAGRNSAGGIEQQYKNIMRKMEEIEDKQENIRLEMRKMNFDIQMLSTTDKLNKKQRKASLFASLFRKTPQISSEYHS